MNRESPRAYSDFTAHQRLPTVVSEHTHEVLKSPECYEAKPRILAFMGASGSGKDLAIEILTSLPGRQSVSQKLELTEPISIRVVPKLTDRPPRITEVSKMPVTIDEFTNHHQQGNLIGEYQLKSNGHRYAYRLEDFTQTCKDQFLIAEPSVLHILELKEKFGDHLHCTFLTSTRGYRERLLIKRGTESPEEIKKRLDEGDGQTFVALLLAGKPPEFIGKFVSEEIAKDFQQLLAAEPETWNSLNSFSSLRDKIGTELVDILEQVVTHKGQVVDELINIERFHTFIDDIVILDDKFITDNPYQAGLFSESIIDTATRLLLNSENRVYSVDQTANTNIICNLVVPEAAKTVDTIFGVSYRQIFESIRGNQENRTLNVGSGPEEKQARVQWISYYEDRKRVFGLLIQDPNHPDAIVSFRATKPDESQEALMEFEIQLSPDMRDIDRHTVQMAFMAKALQLCEVLGIKKFHYAEHFDLVDENDTVIGIVPRSVAHEEGRYIHRAASVLMWRWDPNAQHDQKKKQVLMINRSKHKKMNAGVWSAPSGHVLPGETYSEAARRELREEVGEKLARQIHGLYPVMPIRVYSDLQSNATPQKENFFYFLTHVDTGIADQVSLNYETDGATWVDVDTIRNMMREHPSQFRDAFRMAFQAVDWDKIMTADSRVPLIRSTSLRTNAYI